MLKHDDTIVVGDLHGQYNIAHNILRVTKGHYNIIFVGDYLDSFTHGLDNQIKTLKLVLNAARLESDRVIALMGNHERSYLFEERCSGWNQETQLMVNHIASDCIELLKEYYWMADDLLITHAGVSQDYVKYNPTLTLKESVNLFLGSNERLAVGKARGGTATAGGIYWCDFKFEFLPVDGLRQIFGHTRGNGIRNRNENYCIDCLEDYGQYVLLVRKDFSIDTIRLSDLI